MSDSLTKEAVSSGLFRERTDERSGRKYYVNVRTRKSAWKITAEILQQAQRESGGGGGGASSAAETAEQRRKAQRDERLEQSRKRAELEAQLRASVANLERQKSELESELARLEGPVEAEVEALERMRRELMDSRMSLMHVEKGVMQRRKDQHGLLQTIQSKIASLEAVANNERSHRDAVESRYNQLVEEGMQLSADVQKERVAYDSLKTQVEASEGKIKQIEFDVERLALQLSTKKQELQNAETNLKNACKEQLQIEEEVHALEGEINEINTNLTKRVSFAQRSMNDQKNGGSQKILFGLVAEVETKKKTLAHLTRSGHRKDDVVRMQEQNTVLRHLIAVFDRDKKRLKSLDAFVKAELSQLHTWTMTNKAEALEVHAELQNLRAAVKRHASIVSSGGGGGDQSSSAVGGGVAATTMGTAVSAPLATPQSGLADAVARVKFTPSAAANTQQLPSSINTHSIASAAGHPQSSLSPVVHISSEW